MSGAVPYLLSCPYGVHKVFTFIVVMVLCLIVIGFQSSGHQRGMTEEVCKVKTVGAHSSVSDCNSNHTSNIAATTDKNGETTSSYISNASSQDVDFIQDNSDYQWFLDYG
jgi:hypothetical protein